LDIKSVSDIPTIQSCSFRDIADLMSYIPYSKNPLFVKGKYGNYGILGISEILKLEVPPGDAEGVAEKR